MVATADGRVSGRGDATSNERASLFSVTALAVASAWACVFALGITGCASATSDPGVGPFEQIADLAPRRDAGPRDLASGRDLANADLATATGGDDLSVPDDLASGPVDLAGIPDLARIQDLAALKDFATPPDLSMQQAPPDLAVTKDLAVPKDLAAPPDLTAPPDLMKPADMAGTCVPQTMPCDYLCQNCPQMLKCSFDANHMPGCFLSGTVASGQKCGKNLIDDCVAGDVCVTVSTYGVCFKFCRNDADCPGGGTCTISLQKTTQKVCTEAVTGCAIVPPAGCGIGTACYAVTADGKTGCHASGSGGDGALCNGNYDCKAGFDCVDTTGFGFPTCQQVCRSGMNADCTVQGETCHGVNGWTNGYGVCF